VNTKILKINLFLMLCFAHTKPCAAEYNTKKIFIEVNDLRAVRNPVQSIRADTWKVSEVKAKIQPSRNQAIAVICEGDFPAGVIANDLFRSNGELNRDFKITSSTSVRDICNQQEDVMRIKNPKLFK
jgi:hypothetical protein